MDFRKKLETGKFVKILENVPPKGSSIEKRLECLRPFKGRIDAATFVDSPLGETRMNPIAMASKSVEMGIEPIMHVICRDRNRIGLESDLLAAYALGIRNILALTGDPAKDAKPVFELNSFGLIELVCKMNVKLGIDMFAGAALNINAPGQDNELARARKKIDAGAGFLMTQPCFDPGAIAKIKLGAPVIAGVLVISDIKVAGFFSNVPGIRIPDKLYGAIEDDKVEEYYRRLISDLESTAQGVSIMTIGDYEIAGKLL